METQTLGRVDPTGGGREDGQGGMNGGSNKETSTTVCKPDRPWEVPIWLKELKLGLSATLGGGVGKGEGGALEWEGTWVSLRLIRVDFGRNQCSSVKQLSFN